MNGRKAKQLRQIARELKLPVKTEYAPVGALVHRQGRTYVDRQTGETRTLQGGVVRRPFALKACTRRGYQEAKAIYKGQAQGIQGQREDLTQEVRPFKHRMVDSMRKQPQGPVEE